jgi:hypothetical protein
MRRNPFVPAAAFVLDPALATMLVLRVTKKESA